MTDFFRRCFAVDADCKGFGAVFPQESGADLVEQLLYATTVLQGSPEQPDQGLRHVDATPPSFFSKGQQVKLADAQELNAKAQIAYRICDILEERKLTQKEAAILLGIDQPKVSALLRGRMEGFSSDRLFRFLNALDKDIDIVIRRTKKRSGGSKIRVLAAA